MVLDADAGGTGRRPLDLIEGQKQAIGLWLLDRLPDVARLPGGYEAFGFARGAAIAGAVLYTNYVPYPDGGTIEIWAAGRDWLSRRVLRVIFGYPFDQIGCHRMTALVGRRNRESRTLVEGLGFRLEGVARGGFGPGRDTMIYGMLRRECRWL